MGVEISFQTDSDGFISQECPACDGRFKVKLGEGSDEPISFCPYCSHMGRDCWWTPEQARHIEDSSAEMVRGELDKMAKDFNRKAGSGFLKMNMKVDKSNQPSAKAPEEMDFGWPTFSFGCCGETIKHDKSESKLHCIICGKQHSV